MSHLFSGFRWLCRLGSCGTVLGAGLSRGLLGLAIGGCNLINPDEQVPAYVRIESFAYIPGVAGGPDTYDIASAFVFADNQLLGVFDLPAKVPVLREGPVKLKVEPAIYADGQRGTRVVYPFYTSYSSTSVLTAGTALRLDPATSFTTSATSSTISVQTPFDVADDFTTVTGDRAFTLLSSASYQQEAAVVDTFRTGVGRVQGVEGKTDVFFLESRWKGTLPQKGAAVYLELDYRSTMPFQVGVQYGLPNFPFTGEAADLTVFPKREWTKLYVNLTDEVSRVNNLAYHFQVFIKGYPTGKAKDFLAFDNVRLVRPK